MFCVELFVENGGDFRIFKRRLEVYGANGKLDHIEIVIVGDGGHAVAGFSIQKVVVPAEMAYVLSDKLSFTILPLGLFR
jgi:hypothetical protein